MIKKDVPGSYELPFAAKWMIQTYKVDAVIAIGTLVKGSTMHFEYICQATSDGIMKVGLGNHFATFDLSCFSVYLTM